MERFRPHNRADGEPQAFGASEWVSGGLPRAGELPTLRAVGIAPKSIVMRNIRILASIFGSAAALSCLVDVQAASWPQYRGPSHDGISKETMPAWPAEGLKAAWKTPTLGGFSSLVVENGKAFTLVLREVEGVNREVLACLDADSGQEVWSAPVGLAKYDGGGDSGTKENSGGDGPRSTPSISAGRVYVLSADLNLTAFDAASGKPIWKKDLVKEHGGRNISWKNAASPLIEGNLVLVAGGGEGQALLAFDKKDGRVVWKGENDKMTHATPIATTLLGTRQVIFFTQTGLVSVVPESGKVLWRHPFKYNVSTAASPIVGGDIVYCSAGYGVGATAVQITKSGTNFEAKELWRETGNKLANHWSTPVYKDGFLYGMFQFKEYGSGPLKCVELKTGKVRWEMAGFGPGNVLLAGDRLLTLGDAGQLVLVEANPDAFKELGRFQALTGKCWSTPAYADGRIYVRSTKEAACFDLSRKLSLR